MTLDHTYVANGPVLHTLGDNSYDHTFQITNSKSLSKKKEKLNQGTAFTPYDSKGEIDTTLMLSKSNQGSPKNNNRKISKNDNKI